MAKRKTQPKKPTTRKTVPKRRKKAKKSLFSLKTILLFLLFLTIVPLLVGFYLIKSGKLIYVDKMENSQKTKVQKIDDDELLKKIDKLLANKKLQIDKELEKLKASQKEKKPTSQNMKKEKEPVEQKATEVQDYEENIKNQKVTPLKRKARSYKGKPKLAIVIDDVAFKPDVRRIKAIPYKVTPSFLPPTKRHPNTPTLAKAFGVYMVHLPMEAISFNHPEQRTLRVRDSYKSISKWISDLKTDFPKARYYNNHTGSKFTSNLGAMDRFFKVLKKEKLRFLDSKTTPRSKSAIVANRYRVPLLSRDIFLDNSFEPAKIRAQLRKAIRVAKRHGYAIAICHPHRVTLEVLRKSKPLLKDVEMVYINGI